MPLPTDVWHGNPTLGGMFGNRRPDLIYGESPGLVYEIKPSGSEAAGAAQLQDYLGTPGANAITGDSFTIFRGAPSLTLDSHWFPGRTTYTFAPSGYDGVVTYTVNQQTIFQQVLQAFRQRPVGGPSPLPLPVPGFVPIR